MKLEISEAVELVFRGKCNMVKAAKEAEVELDTLKRLLLERCRKDNYMEPIQLEMLL